MANGENVSIEERIARLEQRVDEIATHLHARPAPRAPLAPLLRPQYRSPLASRSLEWWLARGGAVLTSLALILLYQYAVERNWITPVVRVVMGAVVGAALLYFASRLPRVPAESSDDAVGLREVMLGAGLAAWYITVYAAAVFYGLIPVSAARALFVLLSIGGAWMALSEHRSVLGFLTLAAGFLTPVMLPSGAIVVPLFAVYLAAITAVGLVIYLMRGWQSILWLTAVGFWWSAADIVERLGGGLAFNHVTGSLTVARITMSVLVILAGAALVRAPILRRRLIATGSSLYTEPGRSDFAASVQSSLARQVESFSAVRAAPDSAALWIITILSPLLMIVFLSWIWTGVGPSVWGIASLGLAAFAYRLAASGSDEELTHVEASLTAVLSLAGFLWLADSVGRQLNQSSAFTLAAGSMHAFATLYYLKRSRFIAPQKIATTTAVFCVLVVVLSETVFRGLALRGIEAAWTIAELTVVAVALWIWWTRRNADAPQGVATFFGITSYAALLLIDARILGQVWPPLITASYAVAGAMFLIAARGQRESRALRQIGGFTLVLVFARLFLIDLDRVGTIWRVLLFLGCGALFLFTSHRLQGPSSEKPAEPAG